MMSAIPVNLEKIKDARELDRQILRAGIMAELDAINLYDQMAAMARDPKIKKVLSDIAREEKTHVGEFQALLLALDGEQKRELEHGREEVDEIAKKTLRPR